MYKYLKSFEVRDSDIILQVDIAEVLSARSALMHAGINPWQPAIFNTSAMSMLACHDRGDEEVNQALAVLLGAGQRQQVGC